MGVTFACPECGEELADGGISPGREIVCPECSTLVEVPYLPRAAGWARKRGARGRRASPWLESRLLRGAVVFAAVAILGLAASRMVGGRVRSGRERVLAELVASADEAEAAGAPGPALSRVEAALFQARAMDPKGSARIAELARRRDLASIRDARARLDALDGLDPDAAVGEALILAQKAKADRALDPLAGEIAAKVDAARLRQAQADLEAARRSLDAGDGIKSFAAADRFYKRSGQLADADARRLRPEAEALIESVVSRFGVILAGTDEALESSPLTRPLVEALATRGYLVQARQSTWRPLWDERAPYLASARLVEVREELYLQSQNRITKSEATFDLYDRGKRLWQGRVLARTRAPIPDLPAYLAGHLATAPRRDPEIERRLQADARAVLAEQSAKILRGIPSREAMERRP